jgi:predicted secreted protein
MALFTHVLIFILVWWILFFILLPIKIKVPQKVESGHAIKEMKQKEKDRKQKKTKKDKKN